jgi:predicted Ser/Thr protein kinase
MAKTTIPQVTIHNAETGEVITRDANAKELEQIEADKGIAQAAIEAKAKAEADKAALLARLGLTEDELKTILG